MHFVLLHSIMQSSRRAKQRLLDSLEPPQATSNHTRRKDRTGLVMTLVLLALVVAMVFLA
jgi:hypothetical protein